MVASDSASLGSFLLLRSLAAAIGEAWRIEVVGGVPRWDFFLGTTWKSVELKDWS